MSHCAGDKHFVEHALTALEAETIRCQCRMVEVFICPTSVAEPEPAPSECWPDAINFEADIHDGAVTTYRNGVERGLCLDCGRSWEV